MKVELEYIGNKLYVDASVVWDEVLWPTGGTDSKRIKAYVAKLHCPFCSTMCKIEQQFPHGEPLGQEGCDHFHFIECDRFSWDGPKEEFDLSQLI